MTAESPEHTTELSADDDGRIPMYGPEFTRDPVRVYDLAREHGELAPVELAPGVPATLVVGYDAALEIMRDPGRFPRGSAVWEEEVGPDCPVLPILMARPNALATNGPVHARFRSAIVDSLSRVHPAELRRYVETSADALIDEFAGDGKADLIDQYTRPLPLLVLSDMLGCPRDLADRYERGMAGIIEGADPEASLAMLSEAVQELVALRKADPGRDVTSWMIRHPAALDDDETANQIGMLFASGTEPLNSLVANGLRLLLSDDRFFGGLSGGTLPVQDALDEVLWTDPPISNCGPTFPRRDTEFRGHRLPAHQPVIIGYTAANTDPSRASGDRTGNRAHLAFGGGPHTCPAKGHSRLIAAVAIERLLDRVPEMELAVPVEELEWRPGPFHRALTALPVRFPPIPDPGRRR
ncbi:cytochrome P450 [Actinomadura chibensis]|uniref:Cytochrome P450 n=1 Tax=Actinomadura chibensis TaxID=392828 RepID=A0A5D0NR65_9ACTN|nr:cytochrome P450 [Actinomadura chibensis]TYB46799.1 cytochrome P450 [Actinomadura chibensis]